MLSLDFLDDVRRMNKRQLYYQVLNFGMIVSSALMIWKGLMVVTGSESPIVVVLSGSMEPAFHRGDLLFLTNRVEDPIRVGEIVVFRIEGREIPIVHRVLKIHEKENGDIKFLTKGDNNAVDDRGLYKQGQHWLEKKDVVGRARGMLFSFYWVSLYWFTESELCVKKTGTVLTSFNFDNSWPKRVGYIY
ncbi:signal peptidase complex catalytic subunit SEC11A isoform X1 [Latimeria chalumnae]|uniref:signal peptidase complex catalytic subunit SEC11A isoform X1 n=1 Tax=Latimeria chalumnae TaxID=7897 RepID=UPI0003C16388|nr:PREDICTED: signal peptidase complex catalytic subunit SEC11A isoform X1 [Latimeria chalumnae]|eukprot:XP_005995711.1 PREDICTED: signal peptidase complex catalytic subunit SEC11A isoform X1 [Latimeria chalumnae]